MAMMLMLKEFFHAGLRVGGGVELKIFSVVRLQAEPSLFISNNLFSLGFGPVQDDFQRDFMG